jgi:hypothetical protein
MHALDRPEFMPPARRGSILRFVLPFLRMFCFWLR